MTAEERKEFIRRSYEELFNRGNLAATEEYIGPDFFNYAGPPDWPRGPESIRRAVTMLRTAFPDLRYTIEEVIVEGETIAARWTARGTHQGRLVGPMGSIPATGRPVAFQGITMGRVVDGKAGASWVLMDQLGLLRQLSNTPAAQTQPGEEALNVR
jgi:predicted ester cyclase